MTAETAPAGQDVVLLAHGSPDPRHARDVAALRGRVAAAAPHLRVRAAYLDHHGPSVGETARDLAGHDGEITLVPVLLTRAFHARVDIPAAATELSEGSGRCVRITDALGPDPLLAPALEELLAQRSECQVVVFLAGSSRHDAVDDLIRSLTMSLTPERAYAFATLDDYLPLPAALKGLGRAADTIAVSAMIADGVLRDRMVRRSAEHGIPFADGVLAQTDALTELVLRRIERG